MTKLTDFERSAKLAEIKAVYKSKSRVQERPRIQDAGDVVRYLQAVWNRDTLDLLEEVLLLCLNGSHQAIGWIKVSSGGFNAATVDPRLVFSLALQTASSAIILAHSHPSGAVEPSPQDQSLTIRIKEAGQVLGVTLLDHLILARESHYSFAEHGLL